MRKAMEPAAARKRWSLTALVPLLWLAICFAGFLLPVAWQRLAARR